MIDKLKRSGAHLNSLLNPSQVGYLILYLTNRCNFRCSFCFYYAEIEKGRKPNELTFEELEKISGSLGPLLQLSLTGGEPFLRKEISEITSLFMKKNHARYVTIPTNAWFTDTMVGFLEEVLPKNPLNYLRLVFSIDGIGAEHDRIRSKPGSYKKILESYQAISSLRKKFPNLVLDANAVYSAATEVTLLDTIKTLHKEFDFDNLSITYARGDIKDPSLRKVSAQRYIEINDYLDNLPRKNENRWLYPLWRGVRDISRENLIKTVFHDEFVTPCVAGKKLIVLSETGEVLPCEILNRSMGNIRDYEYDIKKLLKQKSNLELVNWIKESRCKCSFECALGANVVWNFSTYQRLAKSAFKNRGTTGELSPAT